MAKSKVRMTVFSRFILFMIIVVPSAYFGVSYLRGEDGLANLKEAVGIETTTSSSGGSSSASSDGSSSSSSSSSTRSNSEIARLKDDLKEKDERIEELYLENETLKNKLKDQEEQLEKFKEKLEVLFNN